MKKIKDQLKIGIILNYINLIVGNLIPIFYTPIMLELLGQNEYGLYKLASSVTSYVSLMSLGIGSAMTRYLIKSRTEEGKEAEQKIFGLFSVIFTVIGIAAFIVGTILTLCLGLFYGNSLSSEEISRMKVLVFMMVINMAVSFVVSPFLSVVNSHEKFIFIQVTNILTTCVTPLINLLMLYMGYASIGLVASSMIMCIAINISYIIYVRKSMQIKPIFKNLPTNILKEILKFSFWIFVSNIVNQLFNATDTVLIGAIPTLATTGVAIYNIGQTFNNIMFSITTALSSLLGPKINKMVFNNASNDEISDVAIKVARIQSYIMLLIVSGFIVFGRPFIQLYAGDGYEDSYFVAVIMMIPCLVPPIQSVFLSATVARNKHKFRSIVYCFIALLNLTGTWILLHSHGIIGAAFMTGISFIIGHGFIMNFYYSKIMRFNILKFWKSILKLFIIPLFMCLISLLLSKIIDFYNLKNLIITIILYSFIYIILNYIFVMNDYEKSLIKNVLKKIIYRK